MEGLKGSGKPSDREGLSFPASGALHTVIAKKPPTTAPKAGALIRNMAKFWRGMKQKAIRRPCLRCPPKKTARSHRRAP
jgi:hypothetical protein